MQVLVVTCLAQIIVKARQALVARTLNWPIVAHVTSDALVDHDLFCAHFGVTEKSRSPCRPRSTQAAKLKARDTDYLIACVVSICRVCWWITCAVLVVQTVERAYSCLAFKPGIISSVTLLVHSVIDLVPPDIQRACSA
jgi:hypothetical protein